MGSSPNPNPVPVPPPSGPDPKNPPTNPVPSPPTPAVLSGISGVNGDARQVPDQPLYSYNEMMAYGETCYMHGLADKPADEEKE